MEHYNNSKNPSKDSNGDIYQYLIKTSVRESDVLRRLREETQAMPMAIMQISPDQGQFMALMAKLVNAKKCIEVGVFTGYSALSVASALPDGGKIIACDVSEEWTNVGRRYWKEAGVENKIDLRLAPAAETLQALLDAGEEGTFDFAFIDADKSNYLTYYKLVKRLLRPRGVVLIDNVLWHGKVADDSVQDEDTCAIREVNEFVLKDTDMDISTLTLGDGVTICYKK